MRHSPQWKIDRGEDIGGRELHSVGDRWDIWHERHHPVAPRERIAAAPLMADED